ncbi:MAG TPA: hypothetical protein VE933_01385 [Chitinophagaceae bacterium]|nr:hypothetical protein [Chitinophagaceae bacterium]
MIPQFDRLSQGEQEFMYKAPILVAILIAGADGEIDRNEIEEGIAQAKKKQKMASPEMMELFREISEDFEDKLKIVLQSYPVEVSQRNALIVDELSQLNMVFPKLDRDFSIQYYQSICDLAMKVAKSSGGLLGMHSVGSAEARYVKLPMIKDPVAI